MNNIGKCNNCLKNFGYTLIHNGFNETSYAYCDKCGKTAFFDSYSVPEKLKKIFVEESRHHVLSNKLEKFIQPCDCSGNFKHNASPRCPHCNGELSADSTREFIEKNSPATEKGWKWQNNWTDVYAIIVENKKINNCWKHNL